MQYQETKHKFYPLTHVIIRVKIKTREVAMRAKDLIKLLEHNGWHKVSQKGSHLKMMRDKQIEIIPIHNRRYSNWYSKCYPKEDWAKINSPS